MIEPENDDLSVWSGADADATIELLIKKYGKYASVAASWCALCTRGDGRKEDYRFWFEIFKRIREINGRVSPNG